MNAPPSDWMEIPIKAVEWILSAEKKTRENGTAFNEGEKRTGLSSSKCALALCPKIILRNDAVRETERFLTCALLTNAIKPEIESVRSTVIFSQWSFTRYITVFIFRRCSLSLAAFSLRNHRFARFEARIYIRISPTYASLVLEKRTLCAKIDVFDV